VHAVADEQDTARSGRPARAAASRAPIIQPAEVVAALLPEEAAATPVPQHSIKPAQPSIAQPTNLIRAHLTKTTRNAS
jgi:hypothetical protein